MLSKPPKFYTCGELTRASNEPFLSTRLEREEVLRKNNKKKGVLNIKPEQIIVSTGVINWILWSSVCYTATVATRSEIFKVNTLRGKLHQLGSPNLQGISLGKSFSGTEISLIKKTKMAAMGISLKIIYLFLLAGSHRWKVESLQR